MKVTASSLSAKNLIVNTIAFSTRIPVKVPEMQCKFRLELVRWVSFNARPFQGYIFLLVISH